MAHLDTILTKISLPLCSPLEAARALSQRPELLPGFGIAYGLKRPPKGLPRLSSQGLSLALKNLFGHFQDGLLFVQGALTFLSRATIRP